MSSPQLEMAVGLKKGHKVTKTAMKPKPSCEKGCKYYDCISVSNLYNLRTENKMQTERHKMLTGDKMQTGVSMEYLALAMLIT